MKYILVSLCLVFSIPVFSQDATLELPKGCKENYFTTSDNVRIRYVVAGKGDALILLPGWTMPAEVWEKQIEYFSKTHMVIAVDPRSHGKSEKTSEGLYFERMAQDISELTKHLKLPAYYLAGWSWAGPMICTYLKNFDAPEMKGAILVDGPIKLTISFLDLVTNMTRAILHDRVGFTPIFVKGLFEVPQSQGYVDKLSKASLMTPTAAAVTMLAVFMVYSDAEWIQTLQTTKKPILIFAAKGKEAIYDELKLSYVVSPGGGHTPFVDKPEEFNKIVEAFISKK